MAKPPATPPSSDLKGVNRDARAGTTDRTDSDPGGKLDRADTESKAQPDESVPDADKGG